MGFSNGTSKTDKRVEKGGHGPRGIGFHLTVDSHFHIKNKRTFHPRLTTMTQPLKNSWLIY